VNLPMTYLFGPRFLRARSRRGETRPQPPFYRGCLLRSATRHMPPSPRTVPGGKRWWAFAALCSGPAMGPDQHVTLRGEISHVKIPATNQAQVSAGLLRKTYADAFHALEARMRCRWTDLRDRLRGIFRREFRGLKKNVAPIRVRGRNTVRSYGKLAMSGPTRPFCHCGVRVSEWLWRRFVPPARSPSKRRTSMTELPAEHYVG